MRHILATMGMEARLFGRTPQAVFWTFFFPAFLLAVLGSVFGRPEYVQFLIPGLAGMVLASTSFYSIGTLVTHYRATGFLKRLALVPIPSWKFVVAHMLLRGLIVLLVGLELAVLGMLLFGLRLSANPLTLVAVLAVGIPAFLASGFAVGVLAPSVESAGSIASLLFFSMTFLSGAYFPIEQMPEILQRLAKALPLTYFLHGLRVAVSGIGPHEILSDLAVLAVWGAAGGAVAVGRFKWTI